MQIFMQIFMQIYLRSSKWVFLNISTNAHRFTIRLTTYVINICLEKYGFLNISFKGKVSLQNLGGEIAPRR